MSGREQTGRGWRTFWPLLLPVAAYELACFVLLITRGQYLYFMMGWNVFLALLPLVFVSIAKTVRRRWLTAVLAVLWILFLPNAFYLLTDLIHVPKGMSTAGAGGVIYSTSIHQWIQLLVIGVGAVMGTLMGLESLRQVRGWLASVRGSLFSWCAVGAVSLLCGVGIYIGRFLRFNSWDALNIPSIVERMMEEFSWFTVQYIALFTCIIFVLFVFYELIQRSNRT